MKNDPFAQASMSAVEHRATVMLDGSRIPLSVASTDINGTATTTFEHTHGGLFSWDNREAVLIRQLLIHFAASAAAKINLVNLNQSGLPIAGQEFLVRDLGTVSDVALLESDFFLTVQQNQGLQVVANQPGRCAVWAKVERGAAR